jgi:hypothetical protein
MKHSNQSPKRNDPDRGPPMNEGPHYYNKGYVSDEEYFSPGTHDIHGVERGNDYMPMQNEIVSRDTKKIKRSKFSKIA